jgi:hypothetical protein
VTSTISESQFSSPAERTTPFSTIYQPHHQPQRRRRRFDGESCRYWWLDRVARSCKAVPSQSSRCRVPAAPQVRRKRRASRLRSNLPRATGCKLSRRPNDLVRREEVRNYLTDFAPMSAKDLELLAKRGEQLTHIVMSGIGLEVSFATRPNRRTAHMPQR